MTTAQKKLLIAFSKGFRNLNLFERKMDKYFDPVERSNLTVDVIQDDNFVARNYFEERNIPVKAISTFTRLQNKRKLIEYDYVVAFWDGEDLTHFVHTAKILRVPMRLVPVLITKVKNKDNEEFDVYIGRGTPWGNPFPIDVTGVGDGRSAVIEKFRHHFQEKILADSSMKKAVIGLRGMRLGCYCSPLPCHGDVIAEYLNSLDDDDGGDEG